MTYYTDWPTGRYATIYADPPWLETGAGVRGGRRGADRHYSLMKTHDIAALPVRSLVSDNAHLYLWTTNRFLPDALKVTEAWGFDYRTLITWMKDRFGLGQYFRGITEHCLFGVRGVIPYRIRPDGKRAQGVTGFSSPRQGHSCKPEEMRRMIETVSPSPYIELFSRGATAGWDAWGNEPKAERQGAFALDQSATGRSPK